MNITPVNCSYNPQFNGKIKLMTGKEMADFVKKMPKDSAKMDEFVRKNEDDARSFMYSQLITADEDTVKKIVSLFKETVKQIPDDQIKKEINNFIKVIEKRPSDGFVLSELLPKEWTTRQ